VRRFLRVDPIAPHPALLLTVFPLSGYRMTPNPSNQLQKCAVREGSKKQSETTLWKLF